jgi:hypothetical protein
MPDALFLPRTNFFKTHLHGGTDLDCLAVVGSQDLQDALSGFINFMVIEYEQC